MGTYQAVQEEEEAASANTLSTVLSIFSFLAACGVVAVQIMTSNIWTEGEFGKLFE